MHMAPTPISYKIKICFEIFVNMFFQYKSINIYDALVEEC